MSPKLLRVSVEAREDKCLFGQYWPFSSVGEGCTKVSLMHACRVPRQGLGRAPDIGRADTYRKVDTAIIDDCFYKY